MLQNTDLSNFKAPAASVYRALSLAAVFLIFGGGYPAAFAQEPAASVATLPTQSQLADLIEQFMSQDAGYYPGGVITQTPVSKLFEAMEGQGLRVKDGTELVERVLPDNDFLVQELRTPKGQDFWKKIQSLSGGIDRLDHIARMPHGRANVHQMIQKLPNGYSMIVAMTSTERGRRLGDRLSQAPTGRGFNKATGRIYTAKQLTAELLPRLEPISMPGKA